ncbi:2-amino-4-hydroxy-6-hydroxymethyldihydropteridine diphosphokinase [Fredinandcohnia sp. QZ13]|uniref:2-amino-4-hydroxy-6- hydroxymethyldihydropteridine diphosphokinase n=1 Tax=Fredinandcohnia sp. QZ13 TaxID=3073144 RepID=UPI0028532701|nr:2-amino-4-hydroxy-6-hydroxymethyldihydropteridine diphosphokinase [Fredinandcohnia sp. QZ13]MDR4888534.1 2-amino-4-hydroxy-6-hydroxymethyldihydropteridine diphosphokinase [Fredinandcohnia sp. QZ13]
MNNTAYIALGTNIGEREEYLRFALKGIQERGVLIIDFSSIFETDPVGYEDQDLFLNMVIKVSTDLSPFELLQVLQEIELESGRERKIRWGPRTLDLDILLYNHENVETERLIIPHPRMTERAFVLVPLVEIDQNLQIPAVTKPISLLLDELQDREGVRIWKRRSGEDVFVLFEN